MLTMNRDRYIEAMQRYFTAVMAEDLPAIRAVFTEDARVTIYHGDSPERRFGVTPRAGEESLADFYGHIWRNYAVHFGDFTFICDPQSGAGSAIFVPTLTPKPGCVHAALGVLTLRNSNFFWFRGDLIHDTVIYYANPDLGARLGLTTAPVTVPR